VDGVPVAFGKQASEPSPEAMRATSRNVSIQLRQGLLSILVTVVVVYLGWAALLFASQRRMMFPGAGIMLAASGEGRVPPDARQVWLETSGGRVEAWFVPARDTGSAPAVVFAHGNAELIDHGMVDARGLRELGLSVLLVEYPGYGRSGGQPSRASIRETFLAGYDWLAGQGGVDADRIVGMGRSLGSGAITDLATDRPLVALILVSPFTSVAAFAKRYLLPSFVARDRFDNLAVLRRREGPVLLIHGRRDPVIPHAHSERLARASPSAELVSLDCGHNDCPPDRPAYDEVVRSFLVDAGVLHAGPGAGSPDA